MLQHYTAQPVIASNQLRNAVFCWCIILLSACACCWQ